jgi:hypothetical protein
MTDVLQLLPTIFLILIAVLVVITIVYVYRNYSTMKRLLEAQALKRGGTVEKAYANRLLLKFQYHEHPVTVSAHQGSRYEPPETKVHIELPKPTASTVSIHHESLASRIGKAFGSQDIQIGIDEFDSAFMVKADDEQYVRTLLTTTIQNKLLELQHQRPHILLKGQTLDVSVPRLMKTDEQYDQLIDLAIAFVEQIKEST